MLNIYCKKCLLYEKKILLITLLIVFLQVHHIHQVIITQEIRVVGRVLQGPIPRMAPWGLRMVTSLVACCPCLQ